MTQEDSAESLKMLFEEFKYRHELFWKLFFNFSLAILFLLAVPFAYADKIAKVSSLVKYIPLAGAFITVCCYWILRAEYLRLAACGATLKQRTPTEFQQHRFDLSKLTNRLLAKPIGRVISDIFGFGFVALCTAEFTILRWYVSA